MKMKIRRNIPLKLATCVLGALILCAFDQPSVHVQPVDPASPRELEDQTQQAVVRDYLLAWQALGNALEQNRSDLLDAAFVGVAKEKLAATIADQQKLGIQTRYSDRSHDLKLSFYSPEGLSIQLIDTVEYDVDVTDHDKLQATRHVKTRYIAVLSPTEIRWKVRLFQATTQ